MTLCHAAAEFSSIEGQIDSQDAEDITQGVFNARGVSQSIIHVAPAPPVLIRRIKYERPKNAPDRGRWRKENWPPSGEWWVFYKPFRQDEKPRRHLHAQSKTQAWEHCVEVFEIPPTLCPATLRDLRPLMSHEKGRWMLNLLFTTYQTVWWDGSSYIEGRAHSIYHERSSLPTSGESQWLAKTNEPRDATTLKPIPFKLRLNFTSDIEIAEERLFREGLARNCWGLPLTDMCGWLADDLEGWDNHELMCPLCYGDMEYPDRVASCDKCHGKGNVRLGDYTPADFRKRGIKHLD